MEKLTLIFPTESPKFLLSRGRQEDAVATVYGIAHANNRKTWLTVEVLNEVGGYPEEGREVKLSTSEIFLRSFSKFSTERIGPLFGTKRLGTMTALIWICWATIGMGYPLFNAFLPQYLQNAGKDQPLTPTSVVYRNYAITSIIGVPGSIIAAYTVDIKYIGRKYTIAVSTLLTGIVSYLFAAVCTRSLRFTRSATCFGGMCFEDILLTSSLCPQKEMLTPKSDRYCFCSQSAQSQISNSP